MPILITATQIIFGVIIGAFIFIGPWLVIYVVMAGALSDIGDAGIFVGMVFLVVGPFLAPIPIILSFLAQYWISNSFREAHFKHIGKGVWLSYPIGALLIGAVYLHNSSFSFEEYWRDIREEVTSKTPDPIKRVYLSTKPVGSDRYSESCPIACVASLKSGALDSFSIPMNDRNFNVFRFAHGRACANVRISESTEHLAASGHLDQCITASHEENHQYDMRIKYGPEFTRDYGPCCYIAAAWQNQQGRFKLVARWKVREHETDYQNMTRVSLSKVLMEMTGKDFADELNDYGSLTPYPVGSINNELARLASLRRRNAYIYSWKAMATWIERILRNEARQQKLRRITLSDESIKHLIATAPRELWDEHSKGILRYLDQQTVSQLTKAGVVIGPKSK
jgi:hypothetical protein